MNVLFQSFLPVLFDVNGTLLFNTKIHCNSNVYFVRRFKWNCSLEIRIWHMLCHISHTIHYVLNPSSSILLYEVHTIILRSLSNVSLRIHIVFRSLTKDRTFDHREVDWVVQSLVSFQKQSNHVPTSCSTNPMKLGRIEFVVELNQSVNHQQRHYYHNYFLLLRF